MDEAEIEFEAYYLVMEQGADERRRREREDDYAETGWDGDVECD